MKKIGFLVLFSLITFSASAKEKAYTLNITISDITTQKTGDTTDAGSVNRGILGGITHHDRHHEVVSKYIEAIGNDGNSYEISPRDQRNIVLPGVYKARFTNHDLILLFPNGKEEKFQIVAVAKTK